MCGIWSQDSCQLLFGGLWLEKAWERALAVGYMCSICRKVSNGMMLTYITVHKYNTNYISIKSYKKRKSGSEWSLTVYSLKLLLYDAHFSCG